ncbi:probable esterase PIR7A [Ananas comosus]|uniref:Probable esterase PIR7A n=1 Tax=Ananas comosus TaxID=4615 RepID=A0A6P5G177_ANACO|nr:probable esterase PIR7A [Ananas comosus]
MDRRETKMRHFILVHGMCHGAWCWYKVASMLNSAGHRVTAVDLAGSGVDPRRIEELRSFAEYSQPLMDAMAAAVDGRERAIVVGHSLGGLSIALAMQKFPQNVAAAVFVAAVMPSSSNPMSCIAKEFGKKGWEKYYMDSKFSISHNHNQIPVSSIAFGPHFMSDKLYQHSPPEDFVLATMLVRPGRLFIEDAMIDEIAAEKSTYELVSRVYVMCKDDKSMTEEFQRWMIERSPGAEVQEIEGADHMVMLSKPKELFDLLMEIASKYY